MKRSVHSITMTKAEVEAAMKKFRVPQAEYDRLMNGRWNDLAVGPNSPLKQISKPRKKKDDPEHRAQVRLYELLELYADDPRGIACGLDKLLPIIHAIPNFTLRDQSWRSKKQGARYKAEGQRKGMPDNCVPAHRYFNQIGTIGALYVELKFNSYPSDEQREQFRRLAVAGNAVIVVRIDDVEGLAHSALEAILRYLEGDRTFVQLSHRKFTYLP